MRSFDGRAFHARSEEKHLAGYCFGIRSERRLCEEVRFLLIAGKATLIYKRTKNLRQLLGHTKLESTVRYLGIEGR